MRVVVAPDKFAGSLSAVEAADAIAAGWRDAAPGDELVLIPMSDGGPGFIDALYAVLAGQIESTEVSGPLGAPTASRSLMVGGTLYVEAAQACGLHLVEPSAETVRQGTTYGVGELLARAAELRPRRVVVGIGGTATSDGGAGAIRALGWRVLDAEDADVDVAADSLRRAAAVVPAPLHWDRAATFVVATDVENPLLGPNGASAVFGPQKGADRATVLDLDDALRAWADAAEAASGQPGLRDRPGAGAGGGLGFGLMALGAQRTSGFGVVADAVGLDDALREADLVVTGEGALDATSLRGKVVTGVAARAQQLGIPCVAVAGRVEVGRRDAAAAGIDDLYAVTDVAGSAAAALAAGAEGVRTAATRAARAWSRRG